MRRLTRSITGVVRFASHKLLLITAFLSACVIAIAQSPAADAPSISPSQPAAADHRYYLTRCIEQSAEAAKDKTVSPETYRAQCEALESAIDDGYVRSALPHVVSDTTHCDTHDLKTGCSAVREPLGVNPGPGVPGAGPSADGRRRFGKLLDPSSEVPPPLVTDCKEIGCAARYAYGDGYGYGYGFGRPYDQVGALNVSQFGGIANTDYLSDLFMPGFGRFERRKDDTYLRIDFLNPRRCGRYQRYGICLTLTMH